MLKHPAIAGHLLAGQLPIAIGHDLLGTRRSQSLREQHVPQVLDTGHQHAEFHDLDTATGLERVFGALHRAAEIVHGADTEPPEQGLHLDIGSIHVTGPIQPIRPGKPPAGSQVATHMAKVAGAAQTEKPFHKPPS